jgi:DNA-binding response OmpR family regulator
MYKKYLDAKNSGRKIDVILLDYRLGDTNGYHVAHKIKELNDVKIIMITAFHVGMTSKESWKIMN